MVSNWTGVIDPSTLLVMANTNTGGYFWLGILFMIYVVLIIAFIPFGVEASILTSSFVGLVLGIFLVYMSLIGWKWLLFFVGIILFMFIYIVWSSGKT
jgi:hypothetical protein